jgi:regulator of RNase E activity RraA
LLARYSSIPQIHILVHVGGIAIYPDDLLQADCNGVTTIPKDIESAHGQNVVACHAQNRKGNPMWLPL